MTAPHRLACISEWRDALGPHAVAEDDNALARYERTTQPRGTRPCAVLYPNNTDQVLAVVRIAARHAVPLYPISRGKNWGYGDACAPAPDSAIVDLSRMNRILEVNPELGYAVLEPGVSQQQLFDEVRRCAPQFWMDASGAGPNASVVGNILDRGFGHTPYGDHVRTSCGMEVVLADGRLLSTGFGHFSQARTTHVYPYGVGPILDGLFMQSNLGIVTKIGVWLYPAPEAFTFFYIGLDQEDKVGELIDILRPLRMHGLLNSAVHIGNDLRIISSLRGYPWEESNGKTPVSPELRAQLRRQSGVAAWNVSGSLAGPRAQVRAAAKALRRAVAGKARIVFVDDRKLALGQRVVRGLQRFGLGSVMARQLEGLAPNYGLLKGIPTDAPLLGAQWRLRHAPDTMTDPLDSGAGLLWMSPVLPMRGDDVRRLLDGVAPVFAKHAFDLLVTFTLLNERAMVAILNVAFDKAQPGEGEAAEACYAEVLETAKTLGYPPYRSSVLGMPALAGPNDTFWDVARDIKRALDPGDILAPGRYIPPLST